MPPSLAPHRVLSQYAGLEALAVIGIPFKVLNDDLNPAVADYAVPPTLRSLTFDTTECIALKRAIDTGKPASAAGQPRASLGRHHQPRGPASAAAGRLSNPLSLSSPSPSRAGACSGLRELVLRSHDAVQPIMSYVDLQLGGLTSLQSLVLDNVEMHHFGEYDSDVDRIVRTTLPTSLTRMWLTHHSREYVRFNIDPDPQHHHPDYPFLNLAAMTGLRDVRLDAFTLHTGGGGLGTLACFSGLRSLHVRGLALEGAQAAAPLYLDPSTMPQLARLHVVGDCAVDLRRLPESLLELHVELSCHLARSPFRGPVLSLDGRQRGDLVGPLVPRQSFIRAFAFDGIGFDSCPHLSRLVFVGGQVDTLLLEDLFPRLAGLRDSLRELFFAECGMCEPDSPFETAPGAAADATAAITIRYPCTYVPEPVFMEGAIYGTFLNQLHIQLPGCKIAAVSSKPTIYPEIVVFE